MRRNGLFVPTSCRAVEPTSRRGLLLPASRRAVEPTSRGLTLLEVVLAAGLAALLAGSVYESVAVGRRAVESAQEEDLREQLAAAMELLTRELILASDVETAEDQRVQFGADLNDDGEPERVSYEAIGPTLVRRSGTVSVTLLRGLNSFDLNYLDAAGRPMATPVTGASLDEIRVAEVNATVSQEAESWSVANGIYLAHNR